MTGRALDISIITACTGLKVPSAHPPLTLSDFARGRAHVRAVLRRRPASLIPAEQLYRGQQHVRLMRGVEYTRALGHRVSVSIVSAGYGLVAGDEPIASYECTFQGMPAQTRRAWARTLSLAEQVEGGLARTSDAAVVLMGDDYFDACQLGGAIRVGAPTVIICGAKTALRIGPSANVHVVALTENDTRRFACGLVGLKGEVASRLVASLGSGAATVADLGAPGLLDSVAAMQTSSQMAESA